MKSIIFVFLLFLISLKSVNAEAPVKTLRLNNDENIIGYLYIKDPLNLYQKITKLSRTLSHDIVKELEGEIAIFMPILQNANTITLVYYKTKDSFSIGYFITVKDKKVFENIFVTSLEKKEIIENTLVFTEEEDTLKIFKELLPKINLLTSKKDVDLFIDLKNYFKAQKIVNKEEMPNSNILTDQFDMLTYSLNLTNEALNQEIALTPTKNSNLQKMLTQPKTEAMTILDSSGIGNIMSWQFHFDMTKATPFIIDVIKSKQKKEAISEAEKTIFSSMEKNIQSVVDKAGLTQAIFNLKFDKKITTSQFVKCQNAKELLKDFVKCIKQDNTNLISPDFLINNIRDDLAFKVSTIENIGELEAFKIWADNKDGSLPAPNINLFYTANENFIFAADSISQVKENIEKIKAPQNKAATLESFSYFKAGYSSYTDIYVQGIIKAINFLFKEDTGGDIFKKPFNEKVKPIRIACKMDGNLTTQINIDIETFKLIFEIFLMGMNEGEDPLEMEEPSDEDPKNAP